MGGICSAVSDLSGHVVITGCSGGGKSALLEELSRRGHVTVPEPGRRVVQEEMARDGEALPWKDLPAFARRAMDMAARDLERVRGLAGWVFFDRGLIDAASALAHSGGGPLSILLPAPGPYFRTVFLAPPWEEIYHPDKERRHGFEGALQEYQRLVEVYPTYGHELVALPKTSVTERADFVLNTLATG